jgi:hypothetical protein
MIESYIVLAERIRKELDDLEPVFEHVRQERLAFADFLETVSGK